MKPHSSTGRHELVIHLAAIEKREKPHKAPKGFNKLISLMKKPPK